MAGTLALTKAELMRLLRNRRYFIFTLAFPVVLYLLLGRQVAGKANGVAFAAYYMVAMSTFGAFSGALNGNAQRISQEKKEGWIRQLRLTPLPPNAYVVAKVLTSLATTVPSIIIVLILGRFYGNVHLPAWEWPVIAVVVWFGSTIFAALAVAIGYRFAPEQVQPVAFHPRRPVVPAVRRAQEHRQVHPDLPGHENCHRRDPGRLGAGRPGHRPGDLARRLHRPGHVRGAGHRRDGLVRPGGARPAIRGPGRAPPGVNPGRPGSMETR
jgi:ABC-type transport system involved in cytochrome c biogenesis permease component